MTECAIASGPRQCPRAPEVTVAFVDVASGLTLNRRPMCPIHAFAAAARAFVDMERPGLDPLTVILAPL